MGEQYPMQMALRGSCSAGLCPEQSLVHRDHARKQKEGKTIKQARPAFGLARETDLLCWVQFRLELGLPW